MSAALSDLTAEELVMLGFALRLVPDSACLTGDSARALGGGAPLAMFHEVPAFTSLWEKVAVAIRERDDVAPYRRKAA